MTPEEKTLSLRIDKLRHHVDRMVATIGPLGDSLERIEAELPTYAAQFERDMAKLEAVVLEVIGTLEKRIERLEDVAWITRGPSISGGPIVNLEADKSVAEAATAANAASRPEP